MQLAEQIVREFELEQKSNRKAVNPRDIPASYEAITDEWLTHIVCKNHPGATVVDHRLDVPDDGTTNRRRIFLSYNAEGKAADLPPSVFCKSSQRLYMRLMNALSGMTEGEDLYYNKYQPLLGVEGPTCLFASYDRRACNSILVFKDLALDGAEFCNPTTVIDRQRAESQMALLAQLHGRFYDSKAVESSDLPTFEDLFDKLDNWLAFSRFYDSKEIKSSNLPTLEEASGNVRNGFNWKAYCDDGFLEAESVIPARLFRRHAEIWPLTLKSVAMHDSLPRTFAHNDVHLRNWYISGKGDAVLADWQCLARAHWGRDVAYTLATSLTVENRRAWEKELLLFYLDRLQAAGGPTVSFAEAWTFYRQHLFSALLFWTSTLGLAKTQPKDATLAFIERLTTAIDDHDAITSFN